jgi:hypothetical protein
MRARKPSLVALSIALAACGGRAIWDPEHHSNKHPDATSGGGGQTVTSGGGSASDATVTGPAVTVTSTADAASAGSGAGGEGGSTTSSSATASASSTGSGGSGPTTSFEEIVIGPKKSGESFTLEVPEGTLGFTVVVKAPQPYGRMGVKRIESPTKEALVDKWRIPGTPHEFSWYGVTPAGTPQTDAKSAMPSVLPGPWTVTIGDPYSNTTKAGDVSVWLRTSSDGAFHGGFVDVNVFRVPNGASVAYLDNILAKAFNGWGGMKLGTVTYYPLAETFASIDLNNFFPVIEESKPATGVPALNIYVIEEFTGDLKDALGIAAGIPGVGIAPGSPASGVVVMPTSDPELDAEVLKHESGHLSGLFHTTEIDGSAVDTLGDTVSCGSVEMQGLGCPDSSNIMFPFANASADQFSAMQIRVLQGATIYRGALDKLGMGGMKSVAPPVDSAPPTKTLSLAKGAWRTHLAPRAADLLASHWCHDDRPTGRHVDHLAVMRRFASRESLEAVAADSSAPAWLRARAKRAATRP